MTCLSGLHTLLPAVFGWKIFWMAFAAGERTNEPHWAAPAAPSFSTQYSPSPAQHFRQRRTTCIRSSPAGRPGWKSRKKNLRWTIAPQRGREGGWGSHASFRGHEQGLSSSTSRFSSLPSPLPVLDADDAWRFCFFSVLWNCSRFLEIEVDQPPTKRLVAESWSSRKWPYFYSAFSKARTSCGAGSGALRKASWLNLTFAPLQIRLRRVVMGGAPRLGLWRHFFFAIRSYCCFYIVRP